MNQLEAQYKLMNQLSAHHTKMNQFSKQYILTHQLTAHHIQSWPKN